MLNALKAVWDVILHGVLFLVGAFWIVIIGLYVVYFVAWICEKIGIFVKKAFSFPYPSEGSPAHTEILRLRFAFRMVMMIAVVDIALLLILSRFGPVAAQFDALVKRFGGSITITAAGILGAFLVIFTVSVYAIRLLSK